MSIIKFTHLEPWQALPCSEKMTAKKEDKDPRGSEPVPQPWINRFSSLAGPRLREIFDRDLEETPPELVEQIERLRKAERELSGRKRK